MKVEVNITKRYALGIIASIFVVCGLFAVYAYNSNWETSPSTTANLMGHTPDEIDGLHDYIVRIVNEETAGVGTVTCPSTPNYDSTGAPTDPAYTFLSIAGTSCIDSSGSGVGCVLKQEIYYNGVLKVKRQYQFIQSVADPGVWWSSYQTKGSYKNGDTSYTRIVPDYPSTSSTYIRILDDVNLDGGDTGPNFISVKDSSSTYDQKIYICTLNN